MPECAEGCQEQNCLIQPKANGGDGRLHDKCLQDSTLPDRYSGSPTNLDTGMYCIAWASATAW